MTTSIQVQYITLKPFEQKTVTFGGPKTIGYIPTVTAATWSITAFQFSYGASNQPPCPHKIQTMGISIQVQRVMENTLSLMAIQTMCDNSNNTLDQSQSSVTICLIVQLDDAPGAAVNGFIGNTPINCQSGWPLSGETTVNLPAGCSPTVCVAGIAGFWVNFDNAVGNIEEVGAEVIINESGTGIIAALPVIQSSSSCQASCSFVEAGVLVLDSQNIQSLPFPQFTVTDSNTTQTQSLTETNPYTSLGLMMQSFQFRYSGNYEVQHAFGSTSLTGQGQDISLEVSGNMWRPSSGLNDAHTSSPNNFSFTALAIS